MWWVVRWLEDARSSRPGAWNRSRPARVAGRSQALTAIPASGEPRSS
ncbi:MAG: hypothetical protein MZV64_74260 [Ignavibacteriales bacterium]|nr:hypothetical protein [Ignavibacteriales bacterium]